MKKTCYPRSQPTWQTGRCVRITDWALGPKKDLTEDENSYSAVTSNFRLPENKPKSLAVRDRNSAAAFLRVLKTFLKYHPVRDSGWNLI